MTTIADVTDGASHTAAFSEWLLAPPPGDHRPNHDRRRYSFRTNQLSKPDEYDQFRSACLSSAFVPGRSNSPWRGVGWMSLSGDRSLYNHDLMINGPSCLNGSLVREAAWTAGSLHGGNANVLFGDGHVSPIKESISLPVWQAIATRAGGEIVDGLE